MLQCSEDNVSNISEHKRGKHYEQNQRRKEKKKLQKANAEKGGEGLFTVDKLNNEDLKIDLSKVASLA